MLHGILTTDFGTLEGLALIKDEITTFNKGLQPIGSPYWLTNSQKRLSQASGSIVVAFATEEEANRAIRNRLYIVGISVRVNKHYIVVSTS